MKDSFGPNIKKDESLMIEDPSKLKEEIEKLKLQLKEFRVNSKSIDGARRDLIFRRVNYLFKCLVAAETKKAFKPIAEELSAGTADINKEALKNKLMTARF